MSTRKTRNYPVKSRISIAILIQVTNFNQLKNFPHYVYNTHIISQFEPKLILLQTELTSLILKIDDNLLTTTKVAKAKELAEKFNKKSNSLFNSTYAIINNIGGKT